MNFHRLVLPNGVRVLTIPMPSFESVTVLVMVGAGSRYETKKNSGISHFLEHMAFKGTKKRPDAISISSVIDGIGGECNAFTGKETTGYYIKCAATQVTTAMDVLSDMLQNSLFKQEEIDKESGVILEEINLYEDTPMRKIGDVYEQLLYGDTPMGWDIAGKKDIITSIRRSDFIEYMKSLYSADNLTVVVAGGVSVAETEKMVKRYFEKMPKFKTISRVSVVDGQKKAKVLIKKKVTEQVHIALGVRTVGVNHKDRYPLAVLSAVLGGGMSSRLFSEIREKRGLAYYVRSHSEHYTDCGGFVTLAGVDQKRTHDAVSVIVEEYRKIAHDKASEITPAELTKAKEYMKGHLVLELEDSRAVASFYASQELLENQKENPEEALKKIDAVTAEEVHSVAKKYFVPSGLNLAVIGNFSDRQAFEKLLK